MGRKPTPPPGPPERSATFSFTWLLEDEERGNSPDLTGELDGNLEWAKYPIPPALGSGGVHKINLALDMVLFHAIHRFKPAAGRRLLPLAEINGDFPEMVLQVLAAKGGSILHRELDPPAVFEFGQEVTLFRLTRRQRIVPILDTSTDTETMILHIGLSALNRLLGEDDANSLLVFLGLGRGPKVLTRSIPAYVSAKLHSAIPDNVTGPVRRLQTQARVLDYLSSLLEYSNSPDKWQGKAAWKKTDLRELHDLLTQAEGRLPTLDELAKRFGRPARLLNNEFAAEYGETIGAYMASHRLKEAHAAITNSNIPLKVLASRLGYSHVNHFNTAFRNKFGYPPGSLRKLR